MIITIALFGVFMCVSFWLGVKAGAKEQLIKMEKFPEEVIDTSIEKMEIINVEEKSQ